MSQLWMITYDISNHKIRRNISKHLEDHGKRVQYSIFECRLTKKQQQELKKHLDTNIEKHDKINWYPLCNHCEKSIHWQGNGNPTDRNDYYLL